ncbi:VOC family protein [Robiginitalea sp. SC105]|uniref:VOC family protein n=1 Tax=Robiginitalea sp. SC105 TaxID=2762332 RepID=UPI00163A3A1C|nr:VOC family protein [Robiginitalea sp. SC105]MBC2839524.1 VOC family protein [Robiginitalea sp. SC105]
MGVFCELVENGAKPIALSHPMPPEELDASWSDFLRIAGAYGVELYREDAFPETRLFPSALTSGKSLLVIYREPDRLIQYQQWRADVRGRGSGEAFSDRELARRLGRLLGYSPEGINRLLRANSDYRDLASAGITRQVTHLYYANPGEAVAFYSDVLGLERADSTRFRISSDTYLEVHPPDASHPVGLPKSTAIALLTDQLPDWYAHLQQQHVPIKYTYKPRDGGPHDGFVAVDPGGYLLEFELFKQHPENERLMAVLNPAGAVPTKIDSLGFYGSITWTYHRGLLGMQRYYEEVFGFSLVADQGWTKIFRTSGSGFIGLVDERRGMLDYADSKAVEIEWGLSDIDAFDSHARKSWTQYGYRDRRWTGPENYRYQIDGTLSER